MIIAIILGTIINIVSLILGYYLYCMPQAKIGNKLGNEDSWMAYVPFARNVHRMDITGMPLWKMFFVGGLFTVSFIFGIIGLLGWLLATINIGFAIITGAILIVAYLIMYVLFTYEYYTIIADEFYLDRVPTALTLLWFPIVNQTIMILLAVSDRFVTSPYSSGGAVSQDRVTGGPVQSEAGLFGISGMYSGAKLVMKPGEEFIIGRDGILSNIVISANGEKVSRRHCTVRYNALSNSYEIIDHSSNGTFYGNNRMVKDQITTVPHGTTIVIGDKSNQFRLL